MQMRRSRILTSSLEEWRKGATAFCKTFSKEQPTESQTPGLLFPSRLPLNKLLNISELYFSPSLKEARYSALFGKLQ